MNDTPPKSNPSFVKNLALVITPIATIILVATVGIHWASKHADPHGHDAAHMSHNHADPSSTIDENSEPITASLAMGSQIPDFALFKFKGDRLLFSQLKSKVILINFWATWCAPCLIEMPSIIDLWKKYKDQGLMVVFINVDDDPESVMPRYIDQLEIPFPVFIDFKQVATNLFDVSGLPMTVILRKDRTVLYTLTGERNWNDASVHEQIDKWFKD